ncbi:NAD(P)-dependent alcohol dehydrogenase [Azotobacter vinelandii]
MAGTGLAAAPLFSALSASAQAQQPVSPIGIGPFNVRAYGVSGVKAPFAPIQIQRRAVGPKDVLIDILYCGICHSDVHTVRGDWGSSTFPRVPGHEIVGRVVAVGNAVTKFRVGDIAGVGCMVDSCGECENCLADREQVCLKGTTFTYDAPDKVSGGVTYGGYSERVVVTEHFAIRIPPGMDLAATAPLLCAGVTTFSPMQHWRLQPGQRVGVIGLGGLGHVAVKLAAAHRADVTIFTTSPGKLADAQRLGAREAVLSTDQAAMARLASHFDLLISTVPYSFKMQPFMDLLKLDGTLVNVGLLLNLDGTELSGMSLGFGRKSVAGSMIGGIAETQEVIDYCAARNITADIELIRPEQITQAYERVVNKDVRYRFVIDFASSRQA